MPSRFIVRLRALTCGIGIMAMLAGCTIGPALFETSFTQYNDAVRRTLDEQMLANLVRMRYLESPVFLQVSSLNTSFSVGGNAGISGANVTNGGPNTFGANIGGTYSENPTISFSMPESREYYGQLMAPLSSNQILQLIDAGFDSGAVLRTAVRSINGLKNVTIEYSTYPQRPRSYGEFLEALTLIKKLNMEGLVDFAPASGFAVWSGPIGPVGKDSLSQAILAATVVYAKTAGGDLIKNQKGLWELHVFSRRIALRFAPAAGSSPDAQRLKSLLQLDTSKNAYSMFDYEFTKLEKRRTYAGQSPASLDPNAIWDEIGIRGRSMMEVMQIVSTAVHVPEEDANKGVVFVDPTPSGSEVTSLAIKSSKDEPSNASLRVNYRGNWFYIEDNDLRSRASFALLTAMFAATAGTVPGANPVLTLPVGG